MESLFYDTLEKWDRKKRDQRETNTEALGQSMLNAGGEFGPGTSYGRCLKWYNVTPLTFFYRRLYPYLPNLLEFDSITEVLGQNMLNAGGEFGPGTSYGMYL